MHLRHLRYFVTVADEGSVLRAATRLRVAQPALSRQVRHLERELGVELFDRDCHGVHLTNAGTAMLDGARRVFEKLGAAVSNTRRAEEGWFGTIRIGVGRGSLMNPRVGSALQIAQERIPGATLTLVEVPLAAQNEALRAGDLDIAITTGHEERRDFRDVVLYTVLVDSVLMPASDDSPATGGNDAIDARQLRETRGWLVSSVVPRLSALVRQLDALGLEYDQVGSEETAMALVTAGRGWIPTAASAASGAPAGTQVRQLKGLSVDIPISLRTRATDDSKLTRNVLATMLTADGGPKGGLKGGLKGGHKGGHDGGHDLVPPNLELRQLRALTVAIEERSLTRAARRLGLSQSAVSRQLGALERELKCTLLRRPIRDVTPTAAGQIFAKACVALLTLVEGTMARTRRVARGVTGTCIIGTLAQELTNGVLPPKLRALGERFPEVAIEVRELTTAEQVTALEERKIDVAVMGSLHQKYDDAAVTSVLLGNDPMECVAFSETHPLAQRSWLRASDLSGVPFMFVPRQRNPQMYDAVIRGLAEAGVIPNTNGAHNGIRLLWNALVAGNGWTVAPRSVQAHPPRGLAVRPLEGLSIPWSLRLVWRRDESDPSVRKVLDVFRGDAG